MSGQIPVESVDRPERVPGRDFRATNLDLVLATLIAPGLPFVCQWLFQHTGGALVSLILYYGVCCVAIVWWRKGTLDYRWPKHWPWLLFLLSLFVPLAIAALNYGSLPDYHASLPGFLLTILIWVPLNAAMEQLSWFYVLDAWRNRWQSGFLRWLGLIVGIVLLVILVTLIHLLFWVYFLPTARPTPYSWLGIPLNLLLTASYAALYYRSGSMFPTFFIHLLADLQLVLLAHYAIWPYLI